MRDKFGVTIQRVTSDRSAHIPTGAANSPSDLKSSGTWSVGSRVNRGGLVVLVDLETGDAVKDHTEHAIWLAGIRPLDVSVLQ
jgi:hypothetical protein